MAKENVVFGSQYNLIVAFATSLPLVFSSLPLNTSQLLLEIIVVKGRNDKDEGENVSELYLCFVLVEDGDVVAHGDMVALRAKPQKPVLQGQKTKQS